MEGGVPAGVWDSVSFAVLSAPSLQVKEDFKLFLPFPRVEIRSTYLCTSMPVDDMYKEKVRPNRVRDRV